MYPTLDKTKLPYIVLPFSVGIEPTVKYLGGKAKIGERFINIDFVATGGLESERQKALYEFWKSDCIYGTTPFYIALPFMGEAMDDNYPNFLVKFSSDIASDFSITWKLKQKLIIVGEVNRVGELVQNEEKIITWS